MADGGPYIQAACICERVLREQDGVLSAIRIVDRMTLSAPASLPAEEMPPVAVAHTLLLCLKSGEARGSASLKLSVEQPSGLRTPGQTLPVFFEGGDLGVNIVLPLQLQLTQAGLYWIDVHLDDERLVRIPLRFIVQRAG